MPASSERRKTWLFITRKTKPRRKADQNCKETRTEGGPLKKTSRKTWIFSTGETNRKGRSTERMEGRSLKEGRLQEKDTDVLRYKENQIAKEGRLKLQGNASRGRSVEGRKTSRKKGMNSTRKIRSRGKVDWSFKETRIEGRPSKEGRLRERKARTVQGNQIARDGRLKLQGNANRGTSVEGRKTKNEGRGQYGGGRVAGVAD